jgi:hypothetical protein
MTGENGLMFFNLAFIRLSIIGDKKRPGLPAWALSRLS